MTFDVDAYGDNDDDVALDERVVIDTGALYLDLLRDVHELATRAEVDGLTVRICCPACDSELSWRDDHKIFVCGCTGWSVVDLGEPS